MSVYRGDEGAHVNVRFGSKADIARDQLNVRFTPKSRHWLSAAGCPLCAKAKPLDNLNQKVTASHSSYDSPGTTKRSRNRRSNPRHVRDCRAPLRRLSG